jgi:hypothetical protein
MTISEIGARRTGGWRGKAGPAAAAVAINAAFIAALSVTALGVEGRWDPGQPPLIYLDIEPRPLLADERPRVPVAADTPLSAPSASQAAPTSRTAAAPSTATALPSPLRPRLADPTPPGAPPPADVWRVDPSNRSGAMARTLRQGLPGCASPDLLNEMERQHCRNEFARRAENAAPITGSGNPERDARFARQGARRLAEWEQLRRPLSGGVGVVGPADCVGSNFGTGCAGAHLGPVPGVDMQQGARTPINPGEQRPQGFSASIGGLRIGGKDD